MVAFVVSGVDGNWLAAGAQVCLDESGLRVWPLLGAAVSMLCSGVLLFLAQRQIPMGTAYAIWTGIGSVGAFVAGIALFGEPAKIARVICVTLIVSGIVGLKLVSDK